MLVKLPQPLTIANLYKQFTVGLGQILHGETEVTSFTASSADVVPGSLFIACRGVGFDGNSFIEEAYNKGASAVASGDIERLKGRAGFEVSNARTLLSRLSSHAFAHPSRQMRVIGITGTNGKTTTNWMIYHALRLLGESCVRIGTLGYESTSGQSSKDTLTTPPAEAIHCILAEALSQGCKNAVMEISSHALHQSRVDDVALDCAVFTNITHDHLDYHRTFEEYFNAKRKIFEILNSSSKRDKIICINLDATNGRKLNQEFGASFDRNCSFGYSEDCPVWIRNVEQGRSSAKVTLAMQAEDVTLETCYLGKHNAENLAVAFGILRSFGFEASRLQEAFSRIPPVPGRLEPYERNGIATFVDYAHSPDALERVLVCLKEIPHQRLIVVFGCGGDRDWRKRPLMGNIVARLADMAFVTSDNPRTENPQQIIDDILGGELAIGERCEVIPDRAEAISSALSFAKPNDIVLVAGKGHEDYQITGKDKKYFSDQEQIREFFRNND